MHAVEAEGARGVAGQAPGEEKDWRAGGGTGKGGRGVAAATAVAGVIQTEELDGQHPADPPGLRSAQIAECERRGVVDALEDARGDGPLAGIAVAGQAFRRELQAGDALPLPQPFRQGRCR